MIPPLIVLDTMVVVGAISGRPDSADSRILEAIETGEVKLDISDQYLVELVRVMAKPKVSSMMREKPDAPARLFRTAINIGVMGFLERPRQLDWPNLRDPNDAWISIWPSCPKPTISSRGTKGC